MVTSKAKKDDKKQPAKAAARTPDPTIEELAERLKLKPWQVAGVKAAYGWAAGKRMTEKAFKDKLNAWLKGPTAR